MKALKVIRNRSVCSRGIRYAGVLAILVMCTQLQAQQLSTDPIVQENFSGIEQIGSSIGNITQMTFGPDGKLYVATLSNGIKRYDYDPLGNVSNEVTIWSRPDEPSEGRRNGSLGIAFHDDPTLGHVMYISPAVPFTFAPEPIDWPQDIIRLTDDDQDGSWGEAGEVNQTIVSNLGVTDLHQVNQMQIRDDTLYVGIGSRTRTGGDISELSGPPSPSDGEYSYTGSVNWIRDLTQLSSDTTTTNLARFDITNPESDTRPFTSTDQGKLTVYSTGFRNNYGLAFDDEGQLWVSMNQNENPLAPDEIHRSDFQDDHQFPKGNEISGDWKTNADAINAGFFQSFEAPVATLGNHASANGLDFSDVNPEFAGDAFIVRFAAGKDLLAVDGVTGDVTTIATGFANPIDVLTDPLGNLLVGQHVAGGRIHRVSFGDPPSVLGDMDGDGEVTSADWQLFKPTYRMEFPGSTPDETFTQGDFDGNLVVDVLDFQLFKTAFDNAQGAGAFSQLLQVPEPSSTCMLTGILTQAYLCSIRHRRTSRSECTV